MAERHGRVLAELTEVGLEAMRDVQASLLATEDPKAKADLALALQRTQRSVRQTLALEMRLKRERKQQDREDRKDADRQAGTRLLIRKAQVKAAVERLIWNEAEGNEAERLESCLDDLLDEDVLYDAFLEGSVETHIARLSEELGLRTPAHPGEIQDPSGGSASPHSDTSSAVWGPACTGTSGEEEPPAEPLPDHPEWRSSA